MKCDERLWAGLLAARRLGLNGPEALSSQSEPAATLRDFD